ncbi:MAG: hypothetical protein LUG85_06440 [Clostridiales bacterium]|nr:hypothetical protein [Clostridiales bacterium]MCD7828156.1 hypothetical protein [Clostridiales bacterium]
MKKILKHLSLLIVIVLSLTLLSACGDGESDSDENSGETTSQSASQTTAAQAEDDTSVINTVMSPKRMSASIPAEEYLTVFSDYDFSSYSESANDNDERYLVSEDGNYSATYLENDGGTVYAYKFSDIQNAVHYYYYADSGELYCISTEDYFGNTYYYLDSDGQLIGIQSTTYNDTLTRVETVYDSSGKRVAAVYTDESDIYFLNGSLSQITGDEYNSLVDGYVIAMG